LLLALLLLLVQKSYRPRVAVAIWSDCDWIEDTQSRFNGMTGVVNCLVPVTLRFGIESHKLASRDSNAVC
jgi:hypothetical protein